MAYSSLNFAGYSGFRPEPEHQEVEDGTMRAMVYGETKPLFDLMAKIISGYAVSREEQKLRTFFEMIQDGVNDTIDMLTGESTGRIGDER